MILLKYSHYVWIPVCIALGIFLFVRLEPLKLGLHSRRIPNPRTPLSEPSTDFKTNKLDFTQPVSPLLNTTKASVNSPRPLEGVKTAAAARTLRRTKIMYLVQTESCIPSYLQSVLANEKDACDCDIMVLSYEKKCEKVFLGSEASVEYIYNKSISWSKGRNLLYSTAKARQEEYLYYVFLDDDIVLEHKEKSTENPWRTFESFLRRIEPAVAAVPMLNFLSFAYKMRAQDKKCPNISPEDECLPTGRFDAAVNGFHHEAVNYILPYTTRFDDVSWWYTCSYVGIKSEVIFQGHSVLLTKLRGKNNKHRSYPRAKAKDKALLTIIDLIESELPEKYRNKGVLREWRTQGVLHEQISSSYCLPSPPAHKPIVPFEIFDIL